MRKSKKRGQSAPIQTGRSLPNKVTAYSPGHYQARAPEKEVEPKPKKHWFRRSLAAIVLVFFILVVLVGVWDARNISRASQKLFNDSSIFTLASGGPLKTADNGRVNVLIAGYSADDPNHDGADLTDSIILLSMNPVAKTGYMLSIPRDLYVNIPGYGYAKINEAYVDGGMPLLEQAVSKNFQVQIGYNALINYAAVRGIVNSLGGISVYINSPDGRLYDPNKDWTTGGPLVDLNNGWHALNGEQALDLTRARGDPTIYGIPVGFEQSDFQRTADQRLVFSAIKSKLNWKLVLDPRQNGRILNAVADNVKTDASAAEARPLFGLFNSIPNAQLKSVSLRSLNGQNYLSSYVTVYGQDALIPSAGLNDYSQIDAALSQL